MRTIILLIILHILTLLYVYIAFTQFDRATALKLMGLYVGGAMLACLLATLGCLYVASQIHREDGNDE